MRKCGPSGGGTLRRESPQLGHRPSPAAGRATSARSHWPRASHIGLMHCTVKPGRYCIASPQRPHGPAHSLRAKAARDRRSPLAAKLARRSPREEKRPAGGQAPWARGTRGNSALNSGHSAWSGLWCQGENTTRYCGKVAAVNIVIGGYAEPSHAGLPELTKSRFGRPRDVRRTFCVVRK
jgi:hypothetical protein